MAFSSITSGSGLAVLISLIVHAGYDLDTVYV